MTRGRAWPSSHLCLTDRRRYQQSEGQVAEAKSTLQSPELMKLLYSIGNGVTWSASGNISKRAIVLAVTGFDRIFRGSFPTAKRADLRFEQVFDPYRQHNELCSKKCAHLTKRTS
jgi:hypothetical protein